MPNSGLIPDWEERCIFWKNWRETRSKAKKIREKNPPELPNLTAYEDYNTIGRRGAPDIR
jgi:hypothetical protein